MTYLLVLICVMEFDNVINTDAENVRPVSAHERIVALDALRVLAALIVLASTFA